MRANSFASIVWSQFKRKRLARAGLIFVLFLFVIAIFAPFLANNKPIILKMNGKWSMPALHLPAGMAAIDFKKMKRDGGVFMIMPPIPFSETEYDLDDFLQAPSKKHLLGTDDQGRDVLARMVYGSRISLSIGFVAVSIYVSLGILIGAIAGFYGGKIDLIIMRFIEIMMCFPSFFLILAILAFVGPGIYSIMVVIGLTGWTDIARLIRGEFLKLRTQDFVIASEALGARDRRIIFRHLLPNAIAPVLVIATFGVASAILIESSLSFLGFGVPPYQASWGEMLSQSRDYMDIAWWLTMAPGFAIFLTITAYNLIGEGLRDAIDPRLKV